MPWRVIRDGAMLDVVTGTRQDAARRDVAQTATRIYRHGDVPREPLAPDLVERWEAGDPHLRAIVERVDPFPDGEA